MSNKSVKGRRSAPAKSGRSGNRTFYLVLGTVVVLGVGGLVVAGRGGDDTTTAIPFSVAELTAEPDAGVGMQLGPAEALVTIMEFADFQCPHCRTFNSLTGKLLRRNHAGPNGEVRWVAYDFPLNFTNSLSSALAARCAEAQDGFWPMHDLLFARQDEWASDASPKRKFVGYARQVGLDEDAFEACFKSREHMRSIAASKRYGSQLGVTGTPTLFFNGQRLTTNSYEAIEAMIREAVEAAAEVAAAEESASPAS